MSGHLSRKKQRAYYRLVRRRPASGGRHPPDPNGVRADPETVFEIGVVSIIVVRFKGKSRVDICVYQPSQSTFTPSSHFLPFPSNNRLSDAHCETCFLLYSQVVAYDMKQA